MKGFKYCKNYHDYLTFTKSFYGIGSIFETLDEWNAFFGANILTDIDDGSFLQGIEEYTQILEKSPDIYSDFPVIVYYYFDDRIYRAGSLKIQYWDWESSIKIFDNKEK